jgi:hypothetical protein
MFSKLVILSSMNYVVNIPHVIDCSLMVGPVVDSKIKNYNKSFACPLTTVFTLGTIAFRKVGLL